MASSISGKRDPVVLPITHTDIVESLAKGLRDFQAAPRYGLMLGVLVAAGGVLIVMSLTALKMIYLAYPLAAGFAIIAPHLATGLYVVSRELEQGRPAPSLGFIWNAVMNRSEVRWMGFVTLFVFIMWMYQVRFLMALFLGMSGTDASLREFLTMILTSNEGLLFLGIGNIVGAAISLFLFSITVVSFPLVLERDVDLVTAMITSVRAVAASPVPMIGWAAVIVMTLLVSALPMFVGLIVTLPVLGHATWHLYRRVVAPEPADATSAAASGAEVHPGTPASA
mgnify:CR=1 FL=1